MSEAEMEKVAIERFQDLARRAAKAMSPEGHGRMMLMVPRNREPGNRIKLIATVKSPMGEVCMTTALPDGRINVGAWFLAVDVLAFCIASLEKLGGECPVAVVGPEGVA